MDATNRKPLSTWAKKSLSFLVWMSPLFSLGPFFPLGVLFAFPREYKLQMKALVVIGIYVLTWILVFPLELLHRSSLSWETEINAFFSQENNLNLTKFGIVIFVFLCLVLNLFHSLKRNLKREKVRQTKLDATHSNLKIRTEKRIRDAKFDTLLFVFLFALLLTFLFTPLIEFVRGGKTPQQMIPIQEIYSFLFNICLSVSILLISFNRNKIPSILSKTLINYFSGIRNREVWKTYASLGKHFPLVKELQIKSKATFRDRFLPGLGHIYLYEYWRGFPLLFIGLLLWLFLAVWIFSYISPVFGIQFLAGFGLKPGIADKDFFVSSQNIGYAVISFCLLVGLYIYSNTMIERSFSLQNLGLKKDKNGEEEKFFTPGIRKGFKNVLPVSLLFHLILLCLVFLIPISLQRNSQKKDSKKSADHFQPEKMEFYFIDPNIPDEMEGLNGGVITGNETKNSEKGEKITNEKVADNGPQKGYVKKIRGKKVPATYSNYISAKMRVPESYMDYWAKAPQPYSCVVAYTITQDGDVIDVQLVEASNYPDQDLRTLQLVESLSPLMPPPGTKNDIRVTELFWNGPIDPDFVPTELQKEMINLFDGRYMEEINE